MITKREWLEAQGGWNLSDATWLAEFHRLLECARQLADDADDAERRLHELRARGREFLTEFAP